MSKAAHWESVYRTRPVDKVSWFQEHAGLSLDMIRRTGIEPAQARVIDVGAGASVLVDDLLEAGYRQISVLDIAEPALAVSRTRLGSRAAWVDWRVGDVTRVALPEAGFDIWHDRAVFHFLTDESDRRRYIEQVRRAVRPGGYVIVATFGPNGPLKCSDLDICRYTPESLHDEFGTGYELIGHQVEHHTTPAGNSQEFVYCYCRLAG
jgi:SAM-dependent methyltransferase